MPARFSPYRAHFEAENAVLSPILMLFFYSSTVISDCWPGPTRAGLLSKGGTCNNLWSFDTDGDLHCKPLHNSQFKMGDPFTSCSYSAALHRFLCNGQEQEKEASKTRPIEPILQPHPHLRRSLVSQTYSERSDLRTLAHNFALIQMSGRAESSLKRNSISGRESKARR
jgi:hypothetical protein